MADDDRQSKRLATPQAVRITPDERGRGREHRDHSTDRDRRSRQMPPVEVERNDGVPEDADWERTPVHMSPLDQANFRAKRASSTSHLALGKVTQVRLELKADVEKVSGKVDALDEKLDELAAKVSGQDGKLDTLTGMLKDELDAKRNERGTVINVGAQDALSKIREREATGSVKRELSTKIAIGLLGVVLSLATALITYFFATQ